MPEAVIAALDAPSSEDAVRDADTQACIAGGIAEARHGLPGDVTATVRGYLTPDLLETVDRSRERFPPPRR